MSYIEKEIKLPIQNIDIFLDILNSIDAKFLGKTFQRTVRMDQDDLSLEKEKKFLRVRSGVKNVITLKIKKKKENKNVFERTEIETEIKDPEKMAMILFELGFTKEFIMEKYRAEWSYNNTIISFDEMPFGFYIEIEGKEENIYQTVNHLNLDVNKKIIATYWDIFESYKKEKGIKGDNIVFKKKHQSVLFNKINY